MPPTGTLTATETSKTLDWVIENFENGFPGKLPGPSNRIYSPLAKVRHPGGGSSTSSWWEISVALCGGRYDLYLTCKGTEPGNLLNRGGGIRCKYCVYIGSERIPTLREVSGGVKTFTELEQEQWMVLTLFGTLCARRAELLQEGKLRLRVTLEIQDSSSTATTGSTLKESLAKPPHPVWDALFNDKTFTDVTFHCGSEQVQAHRIVLACGSPVLRKMLMTDMREAATGVVEVDDLDADTLRFILRYIYTGRLTDLDPDLILSVIHGAEKYGLDELKRYCFAELVECITEQSVGPLAVVANLYGAQPEVIQVLHDYLNEGFIKRVKENPALRQLVRDHPDAFF